MGFLHSVLLKLLYPTALCLEFLLAAAVFRRRKTASLVFIWMAAGILLVCGDGPVVSALTRRLEWRYLPPQPVPEADCIVVLSGGTVNQMPPRPTIEITDGGGNRVLYGARLYRLGKAPLIICTGGRSDQGSAGRSYAEDMAELLEFLGVPKQAVLTETKAQNTHQHATNLYPILQEKHLHRVLLVTSAMHMPRSMGVFQRLCPGIVFIAAPTDFRSIQGVARPWYHWITAMIPTANHLESFSDLSHEYLGMAYYRIRGWM